MSSVVSIEKSISPMQEYRARAAEIPAGDAEAWRELAQWATGNALGSQVEDAYSHVVAILPDDVEANRRSGGSVSTGDGSARTRATGRRATSSSRASG